MGEENIYDKLKEIFGGIPGNLNVLEEEIDVNLQLEYYEYAKKHRKFATADEVISNKEDLFKNETSFEDKKSLFVQLASLENVEAYRTIERYIQNPDKDLREWAILAYQESRMLLESKILNESQVFISTGLGGKGNKLRYFVVFFTNKSKSFNSFQRKVLTSEVNFHFKQNSAEIEEISFNESFAMLKVVIPLSIPLKNLFKDIIMECNQYGDFLTSNFIITNVRSLSEDEIFDFLCHHNIDVDYEED
jgi:hypothetical protein